jgi:hypothetical protein
MPPSRMRRRRRDRAMPKSELFDLAAEIKGETEKAWRLFDGTKTEWVPKSQVEDNGDGTFTMPEWLAKEKGFT